MSANELAVLRNGQAIARERIPNLAMHQFRRAILDAVADGQRVAALFADAGKEKGEKGRKGEGETARRLVQSTLRQACSRSRGHSWANGLIRRIHFTARADSFHEP